MKLHPDSKEPKTRRRFKSLEAECIATHNGKYDYSLVEFRKMIEPVKIICPDHGVFEQALAHHVRGRACRKCTSARNGIKKRVSKNECLKRFRKAHGNNYDYSSVHYQGNHTPVEIICSEHGPFKQNPAVHWGGAGCPKCSGVYRPTTEEWIERAKAIHGDKYDYRLVDYKSSTVNVTIICPEHGIFEQLPLNHLYHGKGCRFCGGNVASTTEQFIAKAEAIHGKTYDYSRVNYKSRFTPVTIICLKHGKWKQDPGNHLQGKGCVECGPLKAGLSGRLGFEEFLRRAYEAHGDKYDYSLAQLETLDDKLKIICPEHGVFEQSASSHIHSRSGCMKCGGRHPLSTEEFIERSKTIHGNKYDYSKVDYNGVDRSVEIICYEHGPFLQTPYRHMNGTNCPRCQSGSDADAVYIWLADRERFNGKPVYKVGVTSERLGEKRIHQVAARNNQEARIVALASVGPFAREVETKLKKLGDDPQYLVKDGRTEFRAMSESELSEALQIISRYEKITTESLCDLQ